MSISSVHWNSEPSDCRHAAPQTFLVCVHTTGKAQRERKDGKSVHKDETNDAMNKTYVYQKKNACSFMGRHRMV